jgi:O-succinylbenzoate synthase
MTVSELRPYQDKIVVLHLKDGEIATVKVRFVDAEYEDIIVDIIATNRPDLYKRDPANSSYTIPVGSLASAQEVSN